ncbi:MAG: alpha/beta fold hydrolase, partial [Longimicrobiales bacterium]
TTADHTTTWRQVLPEFERTFTVYAMDRRGCGGSADSPVYERMREAEDVAAIVDSIGEPVSVLGHSHGALCGLEATLLTPHVHKLIAYEGVPLRGADDIRSDVIEKLEAILDAGDVEGVLITMLSELVGMPREELELMRAQRDAWAVRLANARTIPRELRAYERYVFEPERFGAMRTPTLLLVGEHSPARELENAKGIADALPDARVGTIPGQHHIAMYTAPEIFVTEVTRFLARW